MKRLFFALFLLYLFLPKAAVAQPRTLTAYLPVISRPPTYTNLGIAWRYGAQGPVDALSIMATAGYFNSSTWRIPTVDAIPIIWGMRPLDIYQMGNMPYCPAYIISPNEPDLSGQAGLSPAETAALYVVLSHRCPESHIIFWNGVLSLPHLRDTILEIAHITGNLPSLPLGIHIYPLTPELTPHGRINEVCDLLRGVGYAECRLWITEIGYCNEYPGAYFVAQNWLRQVGDDARVERIFWYTNNSGGYPTGCNHNLVENGELTLIGRAIRDAQRGYFPQRVTGQDIYE